MAVAASAARRPRVVVPRDDREGFAKIKNTNNTRLHTKSTPELVEKMHGGCIKRGTGLVGLRGGGGEGFGLGRCNVFVCQHALRPVLN